MQFPDKKIVAAGILGTLIFFSTIAWSYFLATAPHADLGIKTVVDTILAKGIVSGLLELLGKAFSLRFTLFALILPLTFALISLLPFYFGRLESHAMAFASSLLALIALIALFGFSGGGILLALFFGIGIIAAIEFTRMRKDELKRFVTLRAVISSTKMALFIVSIGVLLTSAMSAYRDNDANTKKIGDDLIAVAFKPNIGQSGLTDKIADVMLQSQKQGLSVILSTPQFQKLREKTDLDVQAFVLTMDVAGAALESPEVKQKLADEFNKQAEGMQGLASVKQLLTIDVLRKQSPILDMLFRYYWVLLAFGMWTTFLMFANLLVANLAGIYAAVMRKIIELSGVMRPKEAKA